MARQWSCAAYGWKSRQSPQEWAGHLAILSGYSPRLLRFLLLQRQLQDLRSTRLEAFAVERAIAVDPDISLHGRLAASQQPAAPAAAGRWIPYRYPATLSSENSSIKELISSALLQILRHFCYSSRAPLQAADKHVECVSCLGAAHAEPALTGMECHHSSGLHSALHSALLSALAASFLFREQHRPSRSPAFFLPETCEEKAAGHRISASGYEWAYAGCNPAYLTLSPQSFHQLSSPTQTSIPLRANWSHSGRAIMARWTTACHWRLQMGRSCRACTTTSTGSRSCLGCSLQPRGPFTWDETSSLRRSRGRGLRRKRNDLAPPSPINGRYIFGLTMGAFGPSRECAKYYFSG